MVRINLQSQDVVVLLFLVTVAEEDWNFSFLSGALGMSRSQAYRSLERAEFARLWQSETRRVMRRALEEFCVHGVRYAFPARLGASVRGIKTGFGVVGDSPVVLSDEHQYVWPSATGSVRGFEVAPLHVVPVETLTEHPRFYQLLGLLDVFRIGSPRERNVAQELFNALVFE